MAGILLVKLPSKIKDHVVENIEDGANYDDIVQALLAKVGKSMVELENKFFPPRRRSSKDRVERVKELISWGNRVLMLCPKEQDILLFLSEVLCFRSYRRMSVACSGDRVLGT